MSDSCETTGVSAQSFRHEFDLVLDHGIATLAGLGENPEDFVEAHHRLDKQLTQVIEKWKPSNEEKEAVREKAVSLLKDVIEKTGVDVVPCQEPDIRRLCISLMKATGGYGGIVRLDHIVDDTLMHLEDNHFSNREAKELISWLMGFETTDMRKIVDSTGEENNIKHADFLRFLQKNGHGEIARKASNILVNMLSTQSASEMKKPDMPKNNVIALRPLRQG